MKAIRLLVAGLLGAATFTVAAPAGPACAGTERHAVLVVDAEDSGGQYRYCVELPSDDDVSGIDLIVLAHDQYGLTYRFGYGGNAVCMLADVGTDGDDCFADYPEFWGYWHGDDSGGWTWANEGAAATTVEDGDVEGWSWGTGSDGSSHPQPPETTFDSVCEVSVPPPSTDRGGGDHQGTHRQPPHRSQSRHAPHSSHAPHQNKPQTKTTPAPDTTPTPAPDKRPRSRPGGLTGPGPTPAAPPSDFASPDQSPVAATEPTSGRSSSPPVGAIVAVGIAVLFALGAIVLRRRRLQ